MSLPAWTILLGIFALAGCNQASAPAEDGQGKDDALTQHTDACSAAQLGYLSTKSGSDWLGEAIKRANALLAGTRNYRLQLPGGAPAADAKPGAINITVWPVSERGLTPLETAFVPYRCRSIILQTPALAARIEIWNGDQATGLQIEPAAIVTWILLHELGHIHAADSGALEAAPAVRGSDFSNTEQKRRELSADAFAVGLIKKADATQPTAAFLAGMKASLAMTQLSRNLQRDRQLSMFGASVLATPGAFGDVGDTHPNLELRVLISLVMLNDSDESRALLDQFMLTRNRAAHSSSNVLFQAQPD